MRATRALAIVTCAVCALGAPADADDALPADEAGETVSPAQQRLEQRLRRVEMVSELFARQTRVWRLSYPLLYASVDMCPERVRAAAGFSYANAYLFRGAARSAAGALGYDHRVSVVAVARGSTAEAAGIKRRDVLVAIGDWPTPIGEGAVTLTAAKLRDVLERYGRAVLTFERDGARYQVDIAPDFICDYQVLAAPGEAVSAYADGDRVVILHALMDFVADDGELAAVIARELANTLIPGLGIAGTAAEFSLSNFFNWGMESAPTGDPEQDRARARDHGLAADYVAAYLLARAGYDHRAVAALWRRVAAAGLVDAEGGYSVPDGERLARLAAVIAEVDAKLAARSALAPNRDGPPEATASEVAAAAAERPPTRAPAAAPVAEVDGLPWAEAAPDAAAASETAAAEDARVLAVDESMHNDVAMAPLPAPEAPAAAAPRAGFSFDRWFGR